jgi:wyosine [tRNA(Phe)-imidazoG37] synthetase (radical SAM superfamily)
MINYVFGPVASRRLGISLGVDIIPFKTCTLDCIYCECGRTTDLTVERQRFVEPRVILEEVKEAVTRNPHIEYITFSGSGEPTLNKDIGTMISGIKQITPIPIAILTNGTLLYKEVVRKEILQADLVLPSLDAATQDTFALINRPHNELAINTIINGLIDFRKTFKGEIWLEVFIAKDLNDSDRELAEIYRVIKEIRPHRVQLNSLDRPPAYEHVYPVDIDTLERIKEKWQDLPMPVEIIKRIRKREEIASFNRNLENNMLNTIKRRPLTIDDLVTLTGKKRLELFKYLDVLEKEKKIYPRIVGDKIFYAPVSRS